MLKLIQNSVIYPFLLSFYPAVFLFHHNAHEFQSYTIALSKLGLYSLGALAVTVVLWFALKRVERHTRGLVLVALLTFYYGYGYSLLAFSDFQISRHRYLLPLWVFGLVVFFVVLRRFRAKNLSPVTAFINVMSFYLCFSSTFQLATAVWQNLPQARSLQAKFEPAQDKSLPDVYHFVVDAYANARILKERYGIDNSPFLRSLSDLGFKVSDRSFASYPWTGVSSASTFNLSYLKGLKKMEDVRDLLAENLVFEKFREKGYQTIALIPYYPLAAIENTDIKVACPHMDAYSRIYFKTTLLNTLERKLSLGSWSEQVRRSVKCVFEKFDELSRNPGPKYVLTHILPPHNPFVFDADGNEVNYNTSELPTEGIEWDPKAFSYYKGQLLHANTLILETVTNLMRRTEGKAVIILQSDHGPFHAQGWNPESWTHPSDAVIRERLSILNAWYTPKDIPLNEPFFAINTYQILFNSLFNDSLEPKEGKSYFANIYEYDFVDVTEKLLEQKPLPKSMVP